MGDARSRGNDCDRLPSLVKTERISPLFLALPIAKPLRLLSSRFFRSAVVERGGPADHSGAAPELIKEENKNWGRLP